MSLDDIILGEKETGGIQDWIPEDYGFIPANERRDLFFKGKYELRRKHYNNWLMRKKWKNERGNSEMLVKWGMIVIEPSENAFADLMFTLGLR
jgi:hypothetical protein